MICPICEKGNITSKKICSNCEFDFAIYEKSKKMSTNMYNKGLNLLKNGCISEGTKYLENAVLLDSRNIDARNLLGLSYMYLGKIGDSLKQLILSVNLKKEDNLANEYLEEVQKNKNKLAKYDEAIASYNEALTFMKAKNEDVAIIRLKKAISINDNFLDAYKLLVICYMIQKNNEKAMHYLEKANKIDYNNEDLIKYYKEMNPEMSIIKQNYVSDKQKIQKIYMKPSVTPQVNRKKLATSMVILFGVIAVATLITIIAFGMISSGEVSKLKNELKENKVAIEEYEKKIAQLTQDYNEATDRISSIKEDKSTAVDYNKLLNQVEELYKNENLDQATVKLKEINRNSLSDSQKAKYDELYKNTVAVVSKKYYMQGKKNYDAKKYDDAIINLEKAFKYSAIEQFSDDALYYAGLAYEAKGNKDKTLEYMKKIIADYKDSDKFEKASDKKQSLSK